ncbi:hypothetical protein BJP36_37520 [Moorena producens JHB]|uniref:Uncharacterized protein n=1 Tax=Moorena producens (strain JHB) TaxID=1454205 RepID=A0A9Q9UWF1_MOOP1|nr:MULTISPECIES: hypothetical protein [Moorena]NEQ09070.1 hypothetical protein [Moorena sp. SIO4E2]WAN69798.1 hypothetical protein BJP36_37520 [Moorena producens JHB]
MRYFVSIQLSAISRQLYQFDPVGGTGILVERASCPFHSRTGCLNTGY